MPQTSPQNSSYGALPKPGQPVATDARATAQYKPPASAEQPEPVVPEPAAPVVPAAPKTDDDPIDRRPTLSAFQQNQAAQGLEQVSFAEERDPTFSDVADQVSPVKSLLYKMKDVPPSERAKIGSRIGAAIGFQTRGEIGSVIGSTVGAYAGRGLGLVQSGEHEDGVRMQRIGTTLKNMNIVDDDGHVNFKDGTRLPLIFPPGTRLPNVNSLITDGKKDREPYEIDTSHPFSKRATTVARPLARFLANGLLKYGSERNPRDVKAVDRTTALLVNALLKDAKDINQVYDRAKQLTPKFGVTQQQMQQFYDSIKPQLSENEAGDIAQGMEILYA